MPAVLSPAFDPSITSYTAFYKYSELDENGSLRVTATPANGSIAVELTTQTWTNNGYVDANSFPNGGTFSVLDAMRVAIKCTRGKQSIQYIVTAIVSRD